MSRFLHVGASIFWRQVKRHANISTRGKSSLAALIQPSLEANQQSEDNYPYKTVPTKATPLPRLDISGLQTALDQLPKGRPSQITKQAPVLVAKLEQALDTCALHQKERLSKMLSLAYTINASRLSVSALKNKVDMAVELLKKAISLDPENKQADKKLQSIYLLRGEPSKLGRLIFTGRPGDQWEYLEKDLPEEDKLHPTPH